MSFSVGNNSVPENRSNRRFQADFSAPSFRCRWDRDVALLLHLVITILSGAAGGLQRAYGPREVSSLYGLHGILPSGVEWIVIDAHGMAQPVFTQRGEILYAFHLVVTCLNAGHMPLQRSLRVHLGTYRPIGATAIFTSHFPLRAPPVPLVPGPRASLRAVILAAGTFGPNAVESSRSLPDCKSGLKERLRLDHSLVGMDEPKDVGAAET